MSIQAFRQLILRRVPCFRLCQVLLAIQGFDPAEFTFAEANYKLYNRLAGNSFTSSVAGACMLGLLLGILMKAVGSLKEDEDAVGKRKGDLAFLLSKLSLFETCANLLQSKIVSVPLLATLAAQCQSFATVFSRSVRETLKTIQYSILSTMATYIEKYQKVAKAAEGWQMDGVAWAFSMDESSQSNSDFKVLHGSLKTFRAELSSLETFKTHASGNAVVKKLVDEAAVLTTAGQKLCFEAGAIAAIVMVSGFFLVSEDGLDLGTVQEHCQKIYKFDFANLPDKLRRW